MTDAAFQLLVKDHLSPESAGAYNFNVLRGIIEALDAIQVGAGVEVGVFDGGTSWYLLSAFTNLRLIGVDPYLSYHEYDQQRIIQAEATAHTRLKQFGDRSVMLKLSSVTAAASLPNNSFDFVYIDADHTYEAVAQDIEAWYPKVRKGGLFCGHDFRWHGVTKAVVEFAQNHNLKGRFTPPESDIWWFIKTDG